jgi:glyoxylase-like metal-dependent hydrolase (beta-lactamase superfamily II)
LRVLALHTDVVVVVSSVWQTTCSIVRSGDEGFLIDSPVLPEELDALPAVLEQADFPVSGLLATHGDWDHLLGRLTFPDASLGVGEPTATRLTSEPGAAQRALRDFDEQHYIRRERPLGLAGVQELPVPGRLAIGPSHELELHRADGHTSDGTAFLAPWAGVLVCGDYLSPVEIPMISAGGTASAYAATLERLESLVGQAESVVPGHGDPMDRERASRVLEADRAYVEALVAAGPAELPADRRTATQKRIHEQNLARVSGSV